MPTTTSPASTFQDALVSAVKQSRDLALTGLGAWTELVSTVTPLSGLGSFPLPAGAPDPRELVDAGFAAASELLAVQKEFSDKLLDAVVPKTAK
jgi:hypothetical protein